MRERRLLTVSAIFLEVELCFRALPSTYSEAKSFSGSGFSCSEGMGCQLKSSNLFQQP
jgi:hypothetical protein